MPTTVGAERVAAFVLAAAAAAAVLGVWLNPLVTGAGQAGRLLLGLVGVAGLAVVAVALVAASKTRLRLPRRRVRWSWGKHTLTAAALTLAWILRYRERFPAMAGLSDDFHYLGHATSLRVLLRDWWLPHNEHLVPLLRVVCWLTNRLADATGIGVARQLAGTALMAVACALLGTLVVRLTRDAAAGWLAVAVFALGRADEEILLWYTASLWLVPLSMLLVCLHGIESGGRRGYLLACVLSALAPLALSVSAIVGPVTTAWLLARGRTGRRGRLLAFGPALASAATVAASTPYMLRWFETRAYLANSSRESLRELDLVGGAAVTVRRVVDRFLLGWRGAPLDSTVLYAAAFAVPCLALWLALRRRPAAWRWWPLLVWFVLPYAATMPFRADIRYATLHGWSRYELFPQAALAILLGLTAAALRSRPMPTEEAG